MIHPDPSPPGDLVYIRNLDQKHSSPLPTQDSPHVKIDRPHLRIINSSGYSVTESIRMLVGNGANLPCKSWKSWILRVLCVRRNRCSRRGTSLIFLSCNRAWFMSLGSRINNLGIGTKAVSLEKQSCNAVEQRESTFRNCDFRAL